MMSAVPTSDRAFPIMETIGMLCHVPFNEFIMDGLSLSFCGLVCIVMICASTDVRRRAFSVI